MVDTQLLIDESRAVFPGNAIPDNGLRDEALSRNLGKRKLPQNVGSIHSPAFRAAEPILLEERGGIYYVGSVLSADHVMFFIHTERAESGKVFGLGNSVPVNLEPFKRVRNAGVVGIK